MLKVDVTEMFVTYFKTRFNACSRRTGRVTRWQVSVPRCRLTLQTGVLDLSNKIRR